MYTLENDFFINKVTSPDINQSIRMMRQAVATYMKENITYFMDFFPAGKAKFKAHIKAIRDKHEWATHLEIIALQKLLNRPIIIFLPNDKVYVPDNYNDYKGEPIFVYYDNVNHYKGCLNKTNLDLRTIFQQLLNNQEQIKIVAIGKITTFGKNALIERSSSWPLLSVEHYKSKDITPVTDGLSASILQKLPSRSTSTHLESPEKAGNKEKLAREILNQYYTLAVHIGANLTNLDLDKGIVLDRQYLVELQKQGVNVTVVEKNFALLDKQVEKGSFGEKVEEVVDLLIERIAEQLTVLKVNEQRENNQQEGYSYETAEFIL